MLTYEQTKKGYANLWRQAVINPAYHAGAMAIARKIKSEPYWSTFKEVERITGAKAFLVGAWLQRESDLDLGTYLGNGQSLSRVTTVVPEGRGPFTGPKAFVNGAVDAIKLQGMMGIRNWTVPLMLYWTERLNGQGYFGKGENSPYVWSWTNLSQKGKYTSDHGYDPNANDPQPGVAAIIKALAELDPEIAAQLVVEDPGAAPAATPASGPSPAPSAPTAQPAGPATPSAPNPGSTPATQESNMANPTTAAASVPAQQQQIVDPIPQIIAILEAAKTYLPMVAGFFPAPWGGVLKAAVPIIEEGLQLVEDVKNKSGANLFQSIGERIATIGQHVQTTAATARGTTITQVATPAAAGGAPTQGMPNS